MKLVKAAICVLFFIGGIITCYFLKNFPFISWNREVKIYEVFQVCSTLFIGIAIPFFIKKWIDDGRVAKSLLVDEAKEIISESIAIKSKLTECYDKKKIEPEEKQYILHLFSQIECLLENYGNNLKKQFGERCNSDYQDLVVAYHTYSHNITKQDFMADSFNAVDLDFLNLHSIEHNLFISAIRTFSVKMQKL